MLDSIEGRDQRVCVLGLGSGVPALAAAKAGATVVWAERVAKLGETCEQLCERNGVSRRVQVLRGDVPEWEDLGWGSVSSADGGGASERGLSGDPAGRLPLRPADRFDSVITEELSDDLLSDGLLSLARFARRSLLKPGGTFYPRGATVYAALASIRTTACCGFDVRPFNVFRNSDGEPVYDYEEVILNEPNCAAMLSRPVRLFDVDLNAPAADFDAPLAEAAVHATIDAAVTTEGVFNVVVCWYDLDMGPAAVAGAGAGRLSFAPDEAAPRHMYTRAIKQRLFFTSYEQHVRRGDRVTLELSRTPSTFSVRAPADAVAEGAGRLVRWPTANILSYHFPMIAEEPRNRRFEAALSRAVRAYTRRHGGRGPHVLDIGSGTGLLAMMAARCGARRVTSVEMVPAVCEVAREIVRRNGLAATVQVLNVRSDELGADAMGGERADILVSELIDDHVIGDGVLTSIADARRRLLTPEAMIVPRAGRIFALPVSLRARGPPGLALDDLNGARCDQCVLSYPFHSTKLQRIAPSEYEVLGDAVELFDFDWAHAELGGDLERGRTSPPLPLRFRRGGVFNALVLYFTLQMDAEPGMARELDGAEGDDDYSSGLDNAHTHWDLPARFLPVELQVQQGDALTLVATHNVHDVDYIRLYGVGDAMVRGMIGATHLIDSDLGAKLGVSLSRKPPPKGRRRQQVEELGGVVVASLAAQRPRRVGRGGRFHHCSGRAGVHVPSASPDKHKVCLFCVCLCVNDVNVKGDPVSVATAGFFVAEVFRTRSS